MFRGAIDIARRLGVSDNDLGPLSLQRALVKHARGDRRGAAALARQMAELPDVWSVDPETAAGIDTLASMLAQDGDCARARTFRERATTIYGKLAEGGKTARLPARLPAVCRVR